MRTGKYLTQLQGDLQYQAFIPNFLPWTINADPILDDLLSKANIALGRLDGIAETVPDIDFFIWMYVRKEATLSSQIEGTQATFAEVLKAEADVVDDPEKHSDVYEISNYIKAMDYGLERLKDFPISLRLLKEIHKTLLEGVRGEHKNPGEFRTSQNWIGGPTINTASFVPPPSSEVMSLLDNFEKYLHDKSPMPILIKIGLLHLQFETIHPFLDGNGRLGRLLITFYLCQQRILQKPLLYLSEFFMKFRQEYYDRLRSVHTNDDVENWLKFFLEGIIATSDNAVDTARKIIKLREEDIRKVMKLGRSSINGMALLDFLYKQPFIKISQVESLVNIKNPNALALVNKFVAMGILKEITGKRKYKLFAYTNYFDLFD
jgi:Fic family protein